MNRIHRLGLALFLALACPQLSFAQEPGTPEADARAKELFGNGDRLYQDGLYEEAALAWEEAYRLSKRELLLFNLANCYERMGRLDEALDHLNQYRAFAAADESEQLERRIAALEKRIKSLPVEPDPDPDPPPPDPDPPPPDVVPDPIPEPEPEPSGLPVALPVGVAGAGIVTMGIGMVIASSGNKARQTGLDQECATHPGGDTLCQSGAAEFFADAQSAGSTSTLLLIGGGVLTVTGGGLFALTNSSVGIGPRGLILQGRW